jgi:uncharacterized protein YbjQ (UPF0145 family)
MSGTELLMVTTPGLPGNLLRDLLASVRDLVGGRARAYESTLQRAREMALAEMAQRARQLGADAVVGVRIDVEVLGQAGGMLMACASGTAVTLSTPPPPPRLPPPLPAEP